MDRNFRIKSIALLAKKAGVLETFVKNKLKENNSNISGRNNKIISSLNPKMQPLVIRFLELAEQNGIPLVLTSGFRSNKEQERLYQQGRTTKGTIVTHAKPGTSKHNYGLAVDVALLNNKQQPHWSGSNDLWERIGSIGESVGLKWGGRWSGFKDKPHFELKT